MRIDVTLRNVSSKDLEFIRKFFADWEEARRTDLNNDSN